MLRNMARIAVGQIRSTASLTQNLQQCVTLAQKASAVGAKALFLPEASDYIASSAAESLSLVQPASTSPFVQGLCSEARRLRLAINVGVHEPGESLATGQVAESDADAGRPKKLKNTLLWIDEDGQIAQRYQKVHLFDVDVEGGPKLKESDSVEPGKSFLPPFDTQIGRVGLLICFDLRFPLASHTLRHTTQPAEILTYPSAFTIPTGAAHWHVLLRARAIETQSYVVAAAQVGAHNEKRSSYGHSLVVDPWGKIICELGGEWGGEPELGICEVDLGVVDRVRKEVPLVQRGEAYGF